MSPLHILIHFFAVLTFLYTLKTKESRTVFQYFQGDKNVTPGTNGLKQHQSLQKRLTDIPQNSCPAKLLKLLCKIPAMELYLK